MAVGLLADRKEGRAGCSQSAAPAPSYNCPTSNLFLLLRRRSQLRHSKTIQYTSVKVPSLCKRVPKIVSPNIVGGSSTVNCGPPAQKSGLELGVTLVGPTAAIVVDNQTDSLAEGIDGSL